MRGKLRKLTSLPASVLVWMLLNLASCVSLYRGVEGNIYEKMTVFSVIAVSIIAVILVPFLSGGEDQGLARFREVVRNAPVQPLTRDELVDYPVYFWDASRSFRKMVFVADGSFHESPIITANGQDPEVRRSGQWALTPEGVLQITPDVTGRIKNYSRISPESCGVPTVMRLSSCYAEAWFMGKGSLARAQIACFGYPASPAHKEGFTTSLVAGVTVYWATYPCIVPVGSDVVSLNPELAYGMVTFHDDGTLSRSVSNTVDAAPDFNPSLTGTWSLDESLGVMNIDVGLYTTEITLLLHCPEDRTMLVGSTAGRGQWFTHPEHARQDLARYLAVGIHLDRAKSALFL